MKHKNCKGKAMSFVQAVKLMINKKYYITRGNWLLDDYLYIKKDKLYCDGGFLYLKFLRTSDYKAKNWYIWEVK